MSVKDAYRTLGILEGASGDEIKNAYRIMALRWHPERHHNSHNKDAATRHFLEVTNAYRMLVRQGKVKSPPPSMHQPHQKQPPLRRPPPMVQKTSSESSISVESFVHMVASGSTDSLTTPASSKRGSLRSSWNQGVRMPPNRKGTPRPHVFSYEPPPRGAPKGPALYTPPPSFARAPTPGPPPAKQSQLPKTTAAKARAQTGYVPPPPPPPPPPAQASHRPLPNNAPINVPNRPRPADYKQRAPVPLHNPGPQNVPLRNQPNVPHPQSNVPLRPQPNAPLRNQQSVPLRPRPQVNVPLRNQSSVPLRSQQNPPRNQANPLLNQPNIPLHNPPNIPHHNPPNVPLHNPPNVAHRNPPNIPLHNPQNIPHHNPPNIPLHNVPNIPHHNPPNIPLHNPPNIYPSNQPKIPLHSQPNARTQFPPYDLPLPSLGLGPAGEWAFSLSLTLEDLFVGKHFRFGITRSYLSRKSKHVVIEIDIPAGCRAGTRILCRNVGHEWKPGAFQDIAFIIEEVPHDRFVRMFDDLIMDVRLPWVEGLRRQGGKIPLVGVDGRSLVIQIDPPSDKNMVGRSIVKGAGMPVRERGQIVGRGNLVVQWEILPPKAKIMHFMRRLWGTR